MDQEFSNEDSANCFCTLCCSVPHECVTFVKHLSTCRQENKVSLCHEYSMGRSNGGGVFLHVERF